MFFFKQKVNWQAIVGQVGILLHVPAAMAAATLVIGIIYEEWLSLLPFGILALFSLAVGQLMYRSTQRAKAAHLWDAMVIAGVSWLLCSVLTAVPFYWISHVSLKSGIDSEVLKIFSVPINALFEAVSGLTSTGLTMMQHEGPFPYVLQWWRSLLEWVGGLGLVVFILALTHLNKQGFELYYAEARSEKMTKNIEGTAHWIWGIYLIFTFIGGVLFFASGMPLWDSINHAMTVISTGGFTLTKDNFQEYAIATQVIAIFMMLIGAMSFAVHYRIIREKNFGILWKSMQHRLLYFFAIGGGLLTFLLNIWNGNNTHWLYPFFEWVSALTTCGYSTMNLSLFSPMVKLFLIMGMFIGGTTGSTAGGLKLKRMIYLVSGVFLRILSITPKKEKVITKKQGKMTDEPPCVALPSTEKSERLVTAEVLFTLWATPLFLAWFLILRYVPKGRALDALFEVTSAMSNVGLSSGIVHPELPSFAKVIFMFLMWVGRLEITPALVLVLTLPMIFKKKGADGKKS